MRLASTPAGLARGVLAVALALAASVATAQQRGPTPVEVNPPPAAQPVPQRQPGVLESFGRWMDETSAGMRRNFDNAWRGMGGMGDQATSAAKGTADIAASAAKGTADAAATAAKGMGDATKESIDVLGRLGNTRMVTGRENCAIAPNGAPDCRLAAEAMCKAKGFTTGSSLDYQTAENCPATAFLNGRKPAAGECPIEHVVTKAMCQ
jgi:hypothetical protein